MSRWLRGVAHAAVWGAGVETTVLIVRLLGAEGALPLPGALGRVAEVAVLAAVAGAGAGVVAGSVVRYRPRIVSAASAAGLAVTLWLLLGFVLWLPDEAAIQFVGDPLWQRWPSIAAASAFLVVLGFAARRVPDRRVEGLLVHGLGLRAAFAAALVSALAVLPGPKPDPRPDLVLISVDTLRADHLGCYGYPLPTSPEIDRLCSESLVYENALAAAPETIPSYTTLYTGLLPPDHGVFNNFEKADESLTTLAELLGSAGYVTTAVLQGPFPGTFANLDQGFAWIVQRGVVARSPMYTLADAIRSLHAAARSVADERLGRDASVTTDAAERWLREAPQERPLFLHVYWAYPHAPYTPPARYLGLVPEPDVDQELADRVHRYDAEIRFTDVQIGRVLAALAKARGARPRWVVFTADHGEELGRLLPESHDPFFGHSLVLYESSTRVPLVVRPPLVLARAQRLRVPDVVSLTAVAPTLLAAAGLDPAEWMAASLPLAPGEGPDRPAFSVMRRDHHPRARGPVNRMSVREGAWRLIERREQRFDEELLRYDRGSEEIVREEGGSARLQRLQAILHERFPPADRSEPDASRDLTPRERDLLRSLGYIE